MSDFSPSFSIGSEVTGSSEGQQYTSTINPMGATPASATPETQVRPWVAFQERRDQALERIRNPPGAAIEGELCWGGAPSNSNINPTQPDTTGFNTVPPKEEPEDQPSQAYEWREQSRKETKIKVASEDDPEIYVVFARIDEMMMTAPSPPPFNGTTHKWVFQNKDPKKTV